MNDKFSIRQLAYSLVPVHGEEEATNLIKKAAQDHNLNDMQMLELIRQVNVANQYHAFKKANFQVNGEGLDVVTLDPNKIFEKLTKVGAFQLVKKTAGKFQELRERTLKKAAAQVFPEDKTQRKYDFLRELVKQAELDDAAAAKAVHDLQDRLKTELVTVKQAFISESSNFEKLIAPFTALRQKYATLINPDIIDENINRVPTAKDFVQIKASLEKISSLVETCSHLNSLQDIVKRRG